MQGTVWRDTFANAREHEETGKVPRLVFEHEEKPQLQPLRHADFDTDDLETTGVGKTHRVHFDRNDYSVLLASAAMDRLLHDAHVLVFEGDSHRNPPPARRRRGNNEDKKEARA